MHADTILRCQTCDDDTAATDFDQWDDATDHALAAHDGSARFTPIAVPGGS